MKIDKNARARAEHQMFGHLPPAERDAAIARSRALRPVATVGGMTFAVIGEERNRSAEEKRNRRKEEEEEEERDDSDPGVDDDEEEEEEEEEERDGGRVATKRASAGRSSPFSHLSPREQKQAHAETRIRIMARASGARF